MSTGKRSETALVTIFDSAWTPWLELPSELRYAVWQIESSPTTNKLHLQMYLQASSKKTLGGWKNLVDSTTAHIDLARKEDWRRLDAYCSKDADVCASNSDYAGWAEKGLRIEGTPVYRLGTVVEYAGQGRRMDVEALKASLKRGATLLEIFDEHTDAALRFTSGLRFWHGEMAGERQFAEGEKPHMVLYVGPSGCGKSRTARRDWPDAETISFGNGGSSLWFDGYTGKETVILDDYYGEIPFSLIKRMCDYYPLKVQVKGGTVPFRAKTIVFTSTKSWDQWYLNATSGQSEPEWDRRCKDFGVMKQPPYI
jgi:hypothetical protein